MSILKVGDKITYRPNYGTGFPVEAFIESMELTEEPGTSEGIPVTQIFSEEVKANRVVIDLSDGRWCYSSQVDL